MKLRIKKINKIPTKYWNNLEISMIWLYDDTWKWIKWISLNDETINLLLNNDIQLWPSAPQL